MYYQLIRQLLTDQERKQFRALFLLMVIFSFFESIGLSLIIPYVGLLSHNEASLTWINRYSPFSLTQTEMIIGISILFFSLITLKFILQIYVTRESSRFPYEFYKQKSERLYRIYLGQSYLDYVAQHSGFYIKNCTNTIDQSAVALVIYLRYLSTLVTTVFLFALILFENFFVSSLLILLFSLFGIIIHKISKKPQLHSGKEKEAILNKLFQWTSDSFVVFKEIKLYGKEDAFFSQFDSYAKRLSKAYEKSVFYPLLPPLYIEYFAILILLSLVCIYIFSGHPIGGIVAPLLFYGAVGRRLLPSLIQTVSQKIQMQHFVPALKCLATELNKSFKENNLKREMVFENSLKLSEIAFSYNQNGAVLKNLNMEIKKNTSVAIVGPSGSGKSTIVKMLMGLLVPSKGHFYLDDQECKDLNDIKHLIGYVPQDIALMQGSLLENITFFDTKIDRAKLESALEMSQIKEFISSLPEGLDTLVGERGINLSGGQKQRIGIARALYQDPEILLFDEATSSLDTLAESLITETIKKLAGKKTLVAVAHRLATIQNFDRIYVLQEGKIAAFGTHEELLRTCSLYRFYTTRNKGNG